MKSLSTYLYSLAVLLLLTVSSCKKEPSPAPAPAPTPVQPPPSNSASMQVMKNGVLWTTKQPSAIWLYDPQLSASGLFVSGYVGAEKLQACTSTTNQVATQPIEGSFTKPEAFITYSPDGGAAYELIEAVVKVTKVDSVLHKVSGTFSGKVQKGSETVIFSSGNFTNVDYVVVEN